MTNKELNRLFHLNRDIARIKERIEELESAAEGTTTRITGMPGGGMTSDKVAEGAIKLAAMRLRLEASKLDALNELTRLTEYIESIDDPLMRQIMQYRHVNGLPWEEVAALIGGEITGEGCRIAHWRFLKR